MFTRLSVCVVALLAVLALALSGCGGLTEAEEHFKAGVKLQEQGRFEEAIAEYDEAIRLNPQNGQAYDNRGGSYFILGQHQRAIADYDEAIRLDPQNPNAYNNRGAVYFDLGQHQPAIQYYDEAIRLDPQLADAYYNRGLVYSVLDQRSGSGNLNRGISGIAA